MPGRASSWSLVAALMSSFWLSGVLLVLVLVLELEDDDAGVDFPAGAGLEVVPWARRKDGEREDHEQQSTRDSAERFHDDQSPYVGRMLTVES